MNGAQRVRHIILGVLRQALRDAGAEAVRIAGNGRHAELLRSWCEGGLAVAEDGLPLSPLSKTALLLGGSAEAAVFPFGDLYHSQLEELSGGAASPAELALDLALQKYFDERMSWTEASAHLPEAERARIYDRVERARFRRRQAGLVPKLGARTLGIDLYA